MKHTFSIKAMEIEVVVTDDARYKTWTMEVAGEYGWGVTNLENGRTVGGKKPTKDEAQNMIDRSIKAMQELFYASN